MKQFAYFPHPPPPGVSILRTLPFGAVKTAFEASGRLFPLGRMSSFLPGLPGALFQKICGGEAGNPASYNDHLRHRPYLNLIRFPRGNRFPR